MEVFFFLSTAAPFPGRALLLQGSQASSACASGNSSIKLSVEYQRNDPEGEENGITRNRSCPSAALSTTNPTWSGRDRTRRVSCERPATDRPSHGTELEA